MNHQLQAPEELLNDTYYGFIDKTTPSSPSL